MVDLETLRGLVHSGSGADRAFADAMIRIRWSRTSDPGGRLELAQLRASLSAAADRSHAAIRREVARGALRGAALRDHFDAVAWSERDHYVEEVLGIAYPPLDEPTLETELVGYTPSGYDEIVHAFDVTELGSADRFLDVGAGMGKAVMLAALLTGATASGIEREASLCELARQAAGRLAAPIDVQDGDARDAPLADADVVFMYLPFTGAPLAAVMARLVDLGGRGPRSRRRFICAGALDTRRYPNLTIAAPARSWLHVYRWS